MRLQKVDNCTFPTAGNARETGKTGCLDSEGCHGRWCHGRLHLFRHMGLPGTITGITRVHEKDQLGFPGFAHAIRLKKLQVVYNLSGGMRILGWNDLQ